MAEYHVGCGAFGIYAGTLEPKNKSLWRNKSDVTEEAIEAVRDYMVNNLLGGLDCSQGTSNGWEWTLQDDRKVELRVTIKDKYETRTDCETCKYNGECTTDDMASCAHGANIGKSDYVPKEGC